MTRQFAARLENRQGGWHIERDVASFNAIDWRLHVRKARSERTASAAVTTRDWIPDDAIGTVREVQAWSDRAG